MNGNRGLIGLLGIILTFALVFQPAALASSMVKPEAPGSVPGPSSGPIPTIQINPSHGYLGQEILVTGVVPSPAYTKVRIAWLFNGTTYTAAIAQRDANLNYSTHLTVPLTQATGQAKVCAALANETGEFACAQFNLDIPPSGGVSGSLPPGSLPGMASPGTSAPTPPSAFINLSDRAGTVLYSSPVGVDGSFSIGGVAPGIYVYSFTGGVDPGLSSGKVVVDPARTSPLGSSLAKMGYDPVTALACVGNFDAQVGWTRATTSDSTFGYYGDYSGFSSFSSLLDSTLGAAAAIAGRDYDFGVYLEGVSLALTFRTNLQISSGITIDRVEYHLQKPDKSIVSLGSSSSSGDFYSLLHNVMDFPAGRSKLIVAPVVSGVRQCPHTFAIQVDADPMKDPHVQIGASTTWNSVKNWYDFQGTLIKAGSLLPFKYPNPEPTLPLLGKIENSFNAGLHVEGDIRLNGVVHIKIMRAFASAKVFNHPILDKSQDLIDDSVAHVFTDLHDWHQTKVMFVPVKLWEDSFSTEVYNGPLASFWGIVTVKASLSVGLGGQVVIEGTLYPFQPNLDATLHNRVTPSLTVSIWVDILLGIASAGADGKVTVNFSMPLRLNTNDSAHPEMVWMDTPCFSVKITLSAWARVNLIAYKKTWNIGSYDLVNYSNPAGCTALAKAIKEAAPEAVLAPPRVMASPSVASSANGEMLSASVVDTTPAMDQTTPTVMASFFDVNLQEWETPAAVSDGLHNVQDPAVGFIGQSQTPVVVWTQTDLTLAQEEVTGDDINSYLNKQEIYYALWNGNSWGAPVRLTNDSLPDGRPSIGGDLSGATLAWTVNTGGVVTQMQSLRIKVTDWDPQQGRWGPIDELNGNGANPAMNAQVSVARSPNLKALAWTVDIDGDISTNADRHILAVREAANWATPSYDNMGTYPTGGESPSLGIDPTTGRLHMAFLVRGQDGDGISDSGIGNRSILYSGQADANNMWTYQSLGDQGSPVYAEKPVLLFNEAGDESVIFRRFGSAGTNGILGQLALVFRPAGLTGFSTPGYLTDDASQHYQIAASVNPDTHDIAVLAINRAAVPPGLAASNLSLNLKPAAPYRPAMLSYQRLSAGDDTLEFFMKSSQADLALDPNPVISAQHAMPGSNVTVAVTLRNLGIRTATNSNPPISVCLYDGAPPNGNQISCQNLPANISTLSFNDHTQFVFNLTRQTGLQSFFARVTSNGDNGAPANDVAVGALGNIPAPLLTGVFIDGSLPDAIAVQWMPPAAADLGGYRLLRSMTSGGPYELVGETVGTYLPDLLLRHGQIYCYVVQAYDNSGILSPNSSEACGMLPLLNIYLPVISR